MIAALYVESRGVYAGLPDVDLWDRDRDARTYAGPWPVVAHPAMRQMGTVLGRQPDPAAAARLGRRRGMLRRGPGRGATARRCLGAPKGQPCVDRPSDSSRHREPEGGRDGLAGGVDVLRGKGHYGHRSRKTTWWSPPSSLCCGGSESASPSPTRCSHHELRDRAVLASPGRVEVSSLPLAVSADARAERTTPTQDGR